MSACPIESGLREHQRQPLDPASLYAADLSRDPEFLRQMVGDSYAGEFAEQFAAAVLAGESLPGFVERAAQDYVSELVARDGITRFVRDWNVS